MDFYFTPLKEWGQEEKKAVSIGDGLWYSEN